jgi:mannose-6-phosphate isomerase-like protein (cupin superfamily)
MPGANLFVANDHAAIIANDFADMRYHAAVHHLPPGGLAPGRDNDRSETVFFVDVGTIEFMVNGSSWIIGAGSCVRVPAGSSFAYRNAGYETARVLERTMRPAEKLNLVRVTLEYAA